MGRRGGSAVINQSGSAQNVVRVLIAFVLSVAVAALSWGAWADFRASQDRARLSAAGLAGLVEERAGKEFHLALDWLNRLKALIERDGDLLPSPDSIDHLLGSLQPGRKVLIADHKGGVTFFSGGAEVFDVSDWEYFQEHARGSVTHIGPMLFARGSGEPIVTVSVRIDAPDGGFRGIAAMSLAPADLVRLLPVNGSNNAVVKIVRPDGSFVVGNSDIEKQSAFDPLLHARLRQAAHGVWDGVCPVDGAPRFMAHQPFRSLPLVAVAGIPTDAVMAEWWRRQTRVLGGALPLLALVVGLAWWARVAFRRERAATEALAATSAQREMLLSEVHHRVKNNLQIIQSLLTMEFLTAQPEARAGYENSLQRIQAMGMVHELLYSSGEFGRIRCKDYVERLGGLLMGDNGAVSLTVDGDEAEIDIDRAVPFAMAVNEILSNTLKHAFPDGRPGRVFVHLSHRGEVLTLSVIDNGIGMPDGFDPLKSGNMGTRLLMGLAKQLDGSVEFRSLVGTEVRLEMPL